MSVFKEILSGLKATIELNNKVASVAQLADRLAMDVRDLDRRLVRVETIIEITRPDGGTLRLTRE
jgi:hypothetical protein